MRIALGSDHAGFALKEQVKSFLANKGIDTLDVGASSFDPVDYPDYAENAARALLSGEVELGILVCGTGLGICIAANKIKGIRAAAPWNTEVARLSREHNDANILCLAGRYMDPQLALDIVTVWLGASFEKGGRHERRVRKIAALEERFASLQTHNA